MNDNPATDGEWPGREPSGQAMVHRHVDEQHVALFVRGDFAGMFAAYRDHVKLWGEAPDGLSLVMMRQALGAACLYLSSRPLDETVAWTINIKQPPLNLFVTGDAGQCNVTGRVFAEHVEVGATSRLFVEAHRARGEPYRSVIDITGLDVIEIFEQFSLRSDQIKARFFELGDADFLMVRGCPGSSEDWLRSLDRERAALRMHELTRKLDEKVFWFKCGCSLERILQALRRIYAQQFDELFRGESHVEVACPRCGRRWQVARERL
ncbi:MAG: Hsp33 family molecular chaperone HslO [Planctomycetota bacterium]